MLRGLPGKLRHGRLYKLTLHVTDAFGTAAQGLIVVASGPHHFRVMGLTNGRGAVLVASPEELQGNLEADCRGIGVRAPRAPPEDQVIGDWGAVTAGVRDNVRLYVDRGCADQRL